MKHLLICTFLFCLFGCTEESSIATTAEDETLAVQPTEGRMSNATASYSNPIDGKTYTAPGGWTTYQPEGGVRRSKDRIQNGGVRLMTASSAVSERTTVESLAAFIERIEGTAQKTLESTVDEATILAQFTCTPGEFTVELAHQGTISEELLNRFYKQLNLLSPLSVSSAEVVFQVTIGIENGR